MRAVDLTGKQFGRLSVLERVYGKRTYWRCRCVCGEVKIFHGSNLKSGRSKSCGCLGREVSRQTALKLPRRPPTVDGLVRAIMAAYRANNKRRAVPLTFGLNFAQCKKLFLSNCAYCGLPPSNKFSTTKRTYDAFRYHGIDRVDPARGYVNGNCVSSCVTCNYAKQSMRLETFLAWVERVYLHRIKGLRQFAKGPALSSNPVTRNRQRKTSVPS